MAISKSGWDDAWNKPASELTDEEDAALRDHCHEQMWSARLSRDLAMSRPPEGDHEFTPLVIPQEEIPPSGKVGLVLIIGPFVFLTLLVLVLVLLGARPN